MFNLPLRRVYISPPTVCTGNRIVSPQCAQAIKELLDQRYGPSWHVVVGEGFGFDISYEVGRYSVR